MTGSKGRRAGAEYDPVGRLAALADTNYGSARDVGFEYLYTPASQMRRRWASNDLYASTSAYDVSRGYSVNGLNQYTAAGTATFQYDLNGNLRADGATAFVYDAENRLVSASGTRNAALAYDPLGRLYQTSGGSAGITRFLYDGDELVAEYNGTGTLLRRYVHGTGSDDPIVWYEGSGLTQRRTLGADHQGSIVSVAGSTGAALAVTGYDSWGIPNYATLGPEPGRIGRFGYTGQAWIPELGMYHYKARIYSPTLGRFMQTDPVGYDDQVNLYAYVGNDPVNATDPTGQVRCTGDARCTAVHEAARQARATAQYARSQLRDLARAIRRGDTLTSNQTALRDGYERRFGSGSATSSNLSAAGNFFKNVASDIGREGSGARIRFTNAPGIASAPINGTHINIGQDFFQPSAMGNLTQSFAILHEGGHLAGADDMPMPANAPTHLGRASLGAQRAYGIGATDWLGIHRPDIARVNNDSYMCLADSNCGGPF